MSSGSRRVGQPCTGTLRDSVFERNFFNKSAFLRGKLLARVIRVAVPIPAVASASVFHSAAGGGSVVDVVTRRPL